MNTVTRVIRGATLAALALSGSILTLLVLLLVSNVVLRFFGIQILGLYEILTALTVVMLGMSLGDSQREKQHVAIDLLTSKFSQRVQDALAVIMTLLSIVVVAVVAVALARYARFQITAAAASEILRVPTWPALSALILGFALLAIVLLIDGTRRATSLLTGVRTKEIW
ncbi:TRAP transporter small permease [Leucobacter triazinivorans]|nr:TRAP transporter small permease [Leucobacter triazinivorans]